jgi:hypothetical protein
MTSTPDTLDEPDARKLAAKIRSFWHERGYTSVETWTEFAHGCSKRKLGENGRPTQVMLAGGTVDDLRQYITVVVEDVGSADSFVSLGDVADRVIKTLR